MVVVVYHLGCAPVHLDGVVMIAKQVYVAAMSLVYNLYIYVCE